MSLTKHLTTTSDGEGENTYLALDPGVDHASKAQLSCFDPIAREPNKADQPERGEGYTQLSHQLHMKKIS